MDRYVPNPNLFRELAGSAAMRDLLLDHAERGAGVGRGTAPCCSGPTDPAVRRRLEGVLPLG
ncbi:hypothetical protein CLM82_31660 [Streptomyces albidoflavus]|nr:hypothetical protein CLM82_31660 [Streptomyces albidoflavus]